MSAVVIGGGIAGLTTAIALDRAGVGVDVYERADTLGEIGAGISIWLNALRAFGDIGLADTIKSFSVPAGEAGLRTWNGRLLVGPQHTSLARRLEDVAVVMHRADLQRVLLDAFGRDRVRLGKACMSVAQDEAGIAATFADGHVARGDVLIGADGLRSVVRAAEIVEASRRVGLIGQLENRWAIAARDTFIRLIGGRLQSRAIARIIGA